MGRKELKSLVDDLRSNPEVKSKVEERMMEFQERHKKGNKIWFQELGFCLLTANSSARKGIEIQDYLSKFNGMGEMSHEKLTEVLRRMGHRFYQRRAEFIVGAREHTDIKDIVKGFDDERTARKWLAENIKGLGYKESSHFLRNVGYHNVAILDRHILRVLEENGLIDEIPKNLTTKKYKEIEKVVLDFAKEIKVLPSELDLYLWHSRTGEVLK